MDLTLASPTCFPPLPLSPSSSPFAPPGPPLNQSSCEEAISRLYPPPLDRPLIWRQRGSGLARNSLPARYLSSDGTCAVDIDINPERPEQQDVISNFDLWAAAIVVLDYCVAGHGGQNGYLDGLGQGGALKVSITSYYPRVRCHESRGPRAGSCQSVLESMPVGTDLQIFGSVEEREQRDFLVPMIFGGVTQRTCKAALELYGADVRTDQTSFWNVWRAAIAIDAMCVRRGRSGIAWGFGKNNALSVSLTETFGGARNSSGILELPGSLSTLTEDRASIGPAAKVA